MRQCLKNRQPSSKISPLPWNDMEVTSMLKVSSVAMMSTWHIHNLGVSLCLSRKLQTFPIFMPVILWTESFWMCVFTLPLPTPPCHGVMAHVCLLRVYILYSKYGLTFFVCRPGWDWNNDCVGLSKKLPSKSHDKKRHAFLFKQCHCLEVTTSSCT